MVLLEGDTELRKQNMLFVHSGYFPPIFQIRASICMYIDTYAHTHIYEHTRKCLETCIAKNKKMITVMVIKKEIIIVVLTIIQAF